MSASAVHPNWTESALVRTAIAKAGGSDASTLDVLESLHEIMVTLEEVAPGVPFAEIVSAWSPEASKRGRQAAVKLLQYRGVPHNDIHELVGGRVQGEGFVSRYDSHPHAAQIVSEVHAGEPPTDVAERHKVSRQFVYRVVQNWERANGTRPAPARRIVTTIDTCHTHPAYGLLCDWLAKHPTATIDAMRRATGQKRAICQQVHARHAQGNQ